jgi:NAD(P)-dependent dehydrogenase (short-subunit alcohol dehydrogenase family)
MKSLKETTAIISGGLGDIGWAIVRRLHAAGAVVAIGDLHPAVHADQLIDTLSGAGARILYAQVDVSDANAVAAWVSQVEKEVNSAEVVIPNAAIVQSIDLMEIEAGKWQREISINLSGAFHLAQSAAKSLIAANRPGRMVFVGSWVANSPHVNIPAYCVSKAGLQMLTQLFALRLAKHNILVNEVAPGFVDAGLSGRAFEQDPELRKKAQAWVPMRKLITPDEVARHVVDLCDPEIQNVTGSRLIIDGGLSLTRVSNDA